MTSIKKFNANPWGRRVGDCSIRALVLALGFDYREACKQLGVPCRDGYGLMKEDGVDLELIKSRFARYFDIVEDFYEDSDFVPDEFKGSEDDLNIRKFEDNLDIPDTFGITLEEFIDLYKDQGSFLVGLVTNDKNRYGHIVFVNCQPGKNFAVDTFDSSSFLVDSFMRVKKTLSREDPRHYKLDPVSKRFLV